MVELECIVNEYDGELVFLIEENSDESLEISSVTVGDSDKGYRLTMTGSNEVYFLKDIPKDIVDKAVGNTIPLVIINTATNLITGVFTVTPSYGK